MPRCLLQLSLESLATPEQTNHYLVGLLGLSDRGLGIGQCHPRLRLEPGRSRPARARRTSTSVRMLRFSPRATLSSIRARSVLHFSGWTASVSITDVRRLMPSFAGQRSPSRGSKSLLPPCPAFARKPPALRLAIQLRPSSSPLGALRSVLPLAGTEWPTHGWPVVVWCVCPLRMPISAGRREGPYWPDCQCCHRRPRCATLGGGAQLGLRSAPWWLGT